MTCKENFKKLQLKVDSEEILFLVDLWGGSPFNQANKLFEEAPEKRAIVAGLNLPMLIEAYDQRFTMTTAHEIAKAITPTAIDGCKVRPEELQPKAEVAETAANAAPQGEIPEGTVIGDGKIKFVLARLDSRLLHGQVATKLEQSNYNQTELSQFQIMQQKMNYVKNLLSKLLLQEFVLM